MRRLSLGAWSRSPLCSASHCCFVLDVRQGAMAAGLVVTTATFVMIVVKMLGLVYVDHSPKKFDIPLHFWIVLPLEIAYFFADAHLVVGLVQKRPDYLRFWLLSTMLLIIVFVVDLVRLVVMLIMGQEEQQTNYFVAMAIAAAVIPVELVFFVVVNQRYVDMNNELEEEEERERLEKEEKERLETREKELLDMSSTKIYLSETFDMLFPK